MSFLRQGPVAAALLGAAWMVTLAITVSVAVAFVTGEALRPNLLWSLFFGAVLGAAFLFVRLPRIVAMGASIVLGAVLMGLGFGPIVAGEEASMGAQILAVLLLWASFALATDITNDGLAPGSDDRHTFEAAVIRFLTGFGYIFFTAAVAIPLWVMLMTSFKQRSSSAMLSSTHLAGLAPQWASTSSTSRICSARCMWIGP
ncbi:MAG: hypothetical protein AAF618_07845, partial [Pseudomonadota bacterium]